MRIIIVALFSCLVISIQAQDDIKTEIDFYGDAMIYSFDAAHRNFAAEKFKTLFVKYLEETDFATDDLTWNRWASVIQPEDQNFRIITWELRHSDDEYEYFGYIQFGDNRLTELVASEELWTKLSYDTRALDDWPQVLYYKMHQLDKNTILLFGINRNFEYEQVQVVDVLKIDGDEISFGAPIFTNEDDAKFRLVFKYAKDARMTLNYNPELNLLIFDHLIAREGRIPGQGATLLPDGSYEAYRIEGDKLVYVEKVFDHIYEEAPRPFPKTEKQKKDLFGRSKN